MLEAEAFFNKVGHFRKFQERMAERKRIELLEMEAEEHLKWDEDGVE